jgi:hypothetical protein
VPNFVQKAANFYLLALVESPLLAGSRCMTRLKDVLGPRSPLPARITESQLLQDSHEPDYAKSVQHADRQSLQKQCRNAAASDTSSDAADYA